MTLLQSDSAFQGHTVHIQFIKLWTAILQKHV